ncbi:Sec-independent protein translocase protein TatB [Thiovibrio sp. JS02]
MFGIGLPELILIMGIALIVVGPEKLPEMAKSIAKGVLELKKTASALKDNLDQELKDELKQDPWQQKVGEEYPQLPSTSMIEGGTPKIDAVASPVPAPAEETPEAQGGNKAG